MAIVWTRDKHGTSRAFLGNTPLSLSVWWNSLRQRDDPSPRYRASVFGANLKRRFTTDDEARAAAEATARRLIADAALALGEEAPR